MVFPSRSARIRLPSLKTMRETVETASPVAEAYRSARSRKALRSYMCSLHGKHAIRVKHKLTMPLCSKGSGMRTSP